MSLEETLAANTAALDRNSELLEKLVARAEAAGAASGAATTSTDTKGKATKTTKAKDTADAGTTEGGAPALTHDDVKKLVGGWLAEFKEDKADTETEARRAAIKNALAKVADKADAQVVDVPVDQLHRIVAWLEKKKEADAGHGKGRLTPKPVAETSTGADDDI
jgi:polyhydroxyalkanoate synthesis regulator phasin